ncbi:unnamed protein product [Prorocentrum cordatum]|uniref:Mannosyltransferase n=1 Tax=Prorocentrum cordatum TaxID=2364126 RepID=A0ABN9WQM5_9DINO|nr:unnamed protein product [Polarella glacialis]
MAAVRSVAAGALLLVPLAVLAAVHGQLEGWALYSEEEVLDANVMHPIFNSQEHYVEAYWKPAMKQRSRGTSVYTCTDPGQADHAPRERLDALTHVIHQAARALTEVGLSPFLESSALIGWMRHDGQIPWEIDGDLGISAAECRAANATKARLERVVDSQLEVLKFACSCEEDCEGDNKRMAGRFTHRQTGVCIDVFAYGPVKQPQEWQRAPRYAGTEWWERVDDHAGYTFPRDALLPLQQGSFVGSPILLPARPREFLSWEYGSCLDAHVWPWGLLLYTPALWTAHLASAVQGLALVSGPSTSRSWLHLLLLGLYASTVHALLQGGVALLVRALGVLCEAAAVAVQPRICADGVRRRYRWALLAALALLAFGLGSSVRFLACQVDDFYIRPRRPKLWTLCLLGRCWDFGG